MSTVYGSLGLVPVAWVNIERPIIQHITVSVVGHSRALAEINWALREKADLVPSCCWVWTTVIAGLSSSVGPGLTCHHLYSRICTTCSYLRTLRCFSDLHLVNRSGQLWVMSFFGILNNVLALAILKLCVLVQIHALKIDSDTRYCSSLLWASEHIFPHRNNNAKCLGSCQNVARKQRQFKGV